FSSANEPRLRSHRITTLHVGRNGTLWIGTEDGEITTYRQGAFHTFRRFEKDALGGKMIRAIYEDRRGDVWVGADTVGVWRFARGEPAQGAYFGEHQGLALGTVLSINEDRHGQLWLSTTQGLAQLYPGQTGQAGMFSVKMRDG